ncbi:hypothetical protein fugu_010519 [Takifugu bimaculatus]|uniref:Trehalase n=1 Tax=Takifugu bimaculatus TaxID=433685 RepID=A0A4Z2CA84_9TELE|nr:hypothetical protein fugu_010519 [Takifugu bimaculatus]
MHVRALVCVLLLPSWGAAAAPPPCDSGIYCTGPILHRVQTAKLFDDDKHFVDMKLRQPPDVVLAAFHNLSAADAELRHFLDVYFDKPGTELEPWTPLDWHEKPKFLEGISDKDFRAWAEELHKSWKSLSRKIRADVKDRPEFYSQIYTPHPVVIPGGRFRELYYWDTYWVINGLLLAEMKDTALGMIQNFIYLVNRFGFVPNGGRVYYERRSQPPFLPLMVGSYYQATGDKEFLREALPALEREYGFWMQNRSVSLERNGKKHVLNRYNVQVNFPRPESYTDDLELAEGLSEEQKEQLWADLKAGAESGWDFTSRWYIDGSGQNNGTLRETRTSQILPTDLNALLCHCERNLASFHRVLGDGEAAAAYERAAALRLEAIESVLWDAERGAWFDYSLVTHSRHLDFYASNLAPLWAQCYSQPEMGEKAVQYLKRSGALQYPGGIPTSLKESGQQWDYPNAWPPLQHMLIEGLSNVASEEAKQLASELAQRWIRSNWLAYTKHKAMFEKYDVRQEGKPGAGGEYNVQLGFGWTNGVALQLLDRYGATLTSGSGSGRLSAFLLCLVVAPLLL